MEGKIEFDLPTTIGEPAPQIGPPIKKHAERSRVAYELLTNRQSNTQFQIGVEFKCSQFDELAREAADQFLALSFRRYARLSPPPLTETVQFRTR